jgi:hypothetical protein
MAGDWIKMRLDLVEDPAVIYLADQTNLPEPCIVGYLHTLWAWMSRQSDDGTVTGVTLSALARIMRHEQLPALLVQVGWLATEEDGPLPVLRVPNWERHNSQSAKQRGLTAIRMAAHRAQTRDAASVTRPSPEKRREEKRIHGPRTMERMDRKDSQKTKPKPAQRRRRAPAEDARAAVTVDAIADTAQGIFAACRYDGPDGGNLWGVAALLESGIGDLSEAEVYSAARGAALNGQNKPAHFYATLANTLKTRGLDLTTLLRRVQILPDWPKEAPYAALRPHHSK